MPTRVPAVPPEGPNQQWFNTLVPAVNDAYAGTCTTAKRPTNPLIGQHSFDTTIGKPIWCRSLNPNVWVDGQGTVV